MKAEMDKLKVLMLAANPTTTPPLGLAAEARDIQERVDLAERRRQKQGSGQAAAAQLQIEHRAAARIGDLMREIQLVMPAILHFSGHGASDGSLYLEDSVGQAVELRPEDFCELLHEFSSTVRCVFLNACFTEELAENARRAVDCFIGMSGPIDDTAALTFSSAFYQNLALGSSVGRAFNLARLEMSVLKPRERDIPQLFCRDGIDPTKLMLTAAEREQPQSVPRPELKPEIKTAPKPETGGGAQPEWLVALDDGERKQGKLSTALLRRAINAALPTDSLLKAFLLTYHPKLLQLTGDDMSRTAKLNLVLTHLRPESYPAFRQELFDFWTENQP